MAKKVDYYKLGKKAESFYDPILKLKIPTRKAIAKVEGGMKTARLKAALDGRHIEPATEKEYNAFVAGLKEANPDAQAPAAVGVEILNKKNKEQLIAYYKENYEVGVDDVKKFAALVKDEMIAFLVEDEDED